MQPVPVLVTMAVLYQNQHFLMQLRDDRENILYPGKWGLFGGHLELSETPEVGLTREVQEEINYLAKKPTLFRCYSDRKYVRYIFFAPLEVSLESLELNEGQDLDLVPLDNIRLGYNYSDKAGEKRALGTIHRRILLDFTTFAQKNLAEFHPTFG
jgi:8-oxo-dGTP diphosphatase